jgi:O-antigen/teichoic acid export membrane protein
LAFSYIFYLKRIVDVFRTIKINFNLLKDRFRFIVDNYVIFLVYALEEQIDKIIIMPLFGSVILGNFSLGVQAISVLMIFSLVFYKFILPQDASGNNLKKFKIFAILVSVFMSAIGILVGPFLIEEFFPKYIEAKDAIQILSIDPIPATIVLILQSKFLGAERSKTVLYGTILSVSILIVTMFILGTYFGIVGLAWSIIIATTCKSLFLLYHYYRKKMV